mgnify:CR=1 FL=1
MGPTPAHWYPPPGRLDLQRRARLLQPLGWLYGLGLACDRVRHQPQRLPVPVVSVGNLTTGGAGKTPLVIALAGALQQRGWRVAVLLRGYGGRGLDRAVQPTDPAVLVGDEALELAAALPDVQVWVGRQRRQRGRQAIAAGANLVLLDDGLQHWPLARDLELVVVDAGHGLGNGLLLPAGPLRERPSALKRATALVVSGGPGPLHASIPQPPGLPCLRLRPLPPDLKALGPGPLLAFCGLALPAKFFRSLEHAGAQLAACRAFPDHHPYRPAELEALAALAQEHRAQLVTSRKDWWRLPVAWRPRVRAVALQHDPVHLAPLLALIDRRLGEPPAAASTTPGTTQRNSGRSC